MSDYQPSPNILPDSLPKASPHQPGVPNTPKGQPPGLSLLQRLRRPIAACAPALLLLIVFLPLRLPLRTAGTGSWGPAVVRVRPAQAGQLIGAGHLRPPVTVTVSS